MYLSTTNAGLGCAGCSKGMGSIDFSTFGWEDWLLVGMAGMFVFSLWSPNSALFSSGTSSSTKSKRKGPKGRKVTYVGEGGGLGLGSFVWPMILIGGAYVGYLYFTSQQGSGV